MITNAINRKIENILLEFSSHLKEDIVFLDGGARGGLDSTWENIENIIQIIGFEPEPDSYQALLEESKNIDAKLKIFPNAIYDKNGSSSLYITKNEAASSIYPPNESFLSRFKFQMNLKFRRKLI